MFVLWIPWKICTAKLPVHRRTSLPRRRTLVIADLSVSSIGSRPEPYGTSILQMCRLYWQFKFKFNVNQNEKRKQKRNGWSNLRGGRFAPPSQVPPLAFLFSFSFWFTLNLNFPTPNPQPRFQCVKKKHEKNEVWLQWKFGAWRSILSKNHQNRSYPRVFLATLKFGKTRKKL